MTDPKAWDRCPPEGPPALALITGCPRSGTSILGELVGTLEGVDYRFEPGHPWWPWGNGAGLGGSDRLTESDVIRSRGAQRWLEEQDGPVVVEKSPRMVMATRLHRAIFPGVKIIHIVRDGRDVACSLVPGLSAPRHARGHVAWNHVRVPNWPMILDATEPDAIRGAHVWSLAMSIALADLKGTEHCQVRYEDLVEDAEGELRRVARFLGVSVGETTKEACERVSDRPGEQEAAQQTRWHVPHERHVGRWRDLPDDVAAEVDRITRKERAALGYSSGNPT